MLRVIVLYNRPVLTSDNPDWMSEAGVLETVNAVSAALAAHGHEVECVPVDGAPAPLVQRLTDGTGADVVFNLCEGLHGTGQGETHIACLVELCGLALSGSSPECLALVRDKARTKWLLAGAGLPTAEFFCLAPGEPFPQPELAEALRRGPWIVKPACEDGSLGIGPDSVVTELEPLRRKVLEIHERYGPALVERFIAGREFNAAIVNVGEPRLLPLSEIMFEQTSGSPWQMVTYDAKWAPESRACLTTPPRCPAEVDGPLAAELGRVALAAFRVSGCRDYSRIDLRVNEQGRVYILEVNGNPDLSPTAGLARSLAAAGYGYDDFINELAEYVARTRRPGVGCDRI